MCWGAIPRPNDLEERMRTRGLALELDGGNSKEEYLYSGTRAIPERTRYAVSVSLCQRVARQDQPLGIIEKGKSPRGLSSGTAGKTERTSCRAQECRRKSPRGYDGRGYQASLDRVLSCQEIFRGLMLRHEASQQDR